MKNITGLLIMLLMISTAKGQDTLYNSGVLFVQNNTDTLYINGQFINNAAALLTNHGQLYARQNITNDQPAMAIGTGRLILSGTSLQTILGTQSFKTNNLLTNNSNGILLNNNLSVSGTHNFTNGLITTSVTPNYLVYEAGAGYTGLSDAAHVNGWVKKLGSTDFIFPVGNANFERSVALTDLTANSEFAARHNNGVTPFRTQVFSPLVYVDSAEYWTINKLSGGSARVAMNWNDAKVPFPLLMMSDIRAVYYNGTFWTNIGGSASGDIFTIGNITSNSISSFNNHFTFGSTSFVLPVSIKSFTAKRLNGFTRVNWSISNEINVKKYELERSEDGSVFYTISTKFPFNRNSNELYSYDDLLALHGTAYYRLRCIANNGLIRFSAVVTVSANDHKTDFFIVNNPVGSQIVFFAAVGLKGNYQYNISTATGQIVQNGLLEINREGIDFLGLKPTLTSGIYFFKLANQKFSFSQRILRQ